MTPTEQDKELRALLGEMPYFVIDWLELSDNLRHEWKKGGKASDFGGHRTFMQKYEKKLADLIRTEKLKLLDELEAKAQEYVVIGEQLRGLPYFITVDNIKAERNKLEAEL